MKIETYICVYEVDKGMFITLYEYKHANILLCI